MGFQDASGFLGGPLVQVPGALALPVVPARPVEQLWTRGDPHVLVGVLVADKLLERPDLVDDVYRQGVVVDRNASHRVLDHPGEVVVHHKLTEVEGDSHLQHSQTVDYVGTCQRR